MKKIISIITILALLIVACTDRFEKINKNPFSISDEQLGPDYNLGSSFTSLYRSLMPAGANYQYAIDWAADNYVSHTGTPLDEFGGRDMMSYYFIDYWNSYMWDHFYNNQMSPALINVKTAIAANKPLYQAVAELIMVMAVSNVTTYYGPVIYSEYGEQKLSFEYDSEEKLYGLLFDKLDELKGVFTNASALDAVIWKKFDPQYAGASTTADSTGNTKQWAKFVNSYKLRLAMRIVKANPGLAKTKFEEAVSDKVGLILTFNDNFWFRFTGTHALWTMAASWNDCRMGSAHEEVLVGFEDPRIHVFWRNVDNQGNPTNAILSAKFKNNFESFPSNIKDADGNSVPNYVFPKPAFRYKGIAPGANLDSDKLRDCYSSAGTFHNVLTDGFRKRPILLASEINFLLAEAAVRGWAVPQSAQFYYEEGIKQSFAEWEVPNAAAALVIYLNDDINMPIDYDDPADPKNNVKDSKNSYETRMKNPDAYTIKWKDGIDRELQLERIMTQKWIAGFQNSIEVWSDFRRTDYPKLPYVSMNNSTSEWGSIPEGEFIKRRPFVESERLSNPGLKEAINKLPSPSLNTMTNRLWIHPDKANF